MKYGRRPPAATSTVPTKESIFLLVRFAMRPTTAADATAMRLGSDISICTAEAPASGKSDMIRPSEGVMPNAAMESSVSEKMPAFIFA